MKYLTNVALIYYFYWTALILFESSQLSNKKPDTSGIKQLAYYLTAPQYHCGVQNLITLIPPSLTEGIHPSRLSLSIIFLTRCTHSFPLHLPAIVFSTTWIYYCPYNHTIVICVFLPGRTKELLEDKHYLIHFSISGTTAVPGTLIRPLKTVRVFRESIFSPTEVQLTNQVIDYVKPRY